MLLYLEDFHDRSVVQITYIKNDPNKKIPLYHDCRDIVQHISEIGKLAENLTIEKKLFVPYTFAIPFLYIKVVLEWEYTDFFNFQVDNNFALSLRYGL